MHISVIACRGILAGVTTIVLALASPAWALDAVVTACHDGDTCTAIATKDGARIQVRLHGVDAPELDQPFGTQARTMMSALVIGRHVDLHPAGHNHDRLVADVVLRDGRNVAALLVTEGAAWVDARHNTDPTAPTRQAAAQQARRGLWRDASAVPPWEWRERPAQDPAPKRSWWSRAWSWR
jgi:endonuclease YncB( thermonuclease family)